MGEVALYVFQALPFQNKIQGEIAAFDLNSDFIPVNV